MEKRVIKIYLSAAAYERLNTLSQRIAAELGRKQGRGEHGRNSSTIETALRLVSDEAVLDAERQAA